MQRCPTVCSCSCSSSSLGAGASRRALSAARERRAPSPSAWSCSARSARGVAPPRAGKLLSAATRSRLAPAPGAARARARAGRRPRVRRSSTRSPCRPSARRRPGWPDLDAEREVQSAARGAQPRAALSPDRLGGPVRARGLARSGARDQGRLGRGRAGRRRAAGCTRASCPGADRPACAGNGSAIARRRCARRSAWPSCSAGAARRCCARSSCCARAWTSTTDASRTRRSSCGPPTRPRSQSCRGEQREDLAIRIAELEQAARRRRRAGKRRAGALPPSSTPRSLRHALGRLEAALRARTAPGFRLSERGPDDDSDRHVERRALHALRRAARRRSPARRCCGRARDRHGDHRRRLRRRRGRPGARARAGGRRARGLLPRRRDRPRLLRGRARGRQGLPALHRPAPARRGDYGDYIRMATERSLRALRRRPLRPAAAAQPRSHRLHAARPCGRACRRVRDAGPDAPARRRARARPTASRST